jgi:hypothetical protein
MIVFLLLLLVLIAVFPGRNTSTYEEFCKAECWSMRKPCCRSV